MGWIWHLGFRQASTPGFNIRRRWRQERRKPDGTAIRRSRLRPILDLAGSLGEADDAIQDDKGGNTTCRECVFLLGDRGS